FTKEVPCEEGVRRSGGVFAARCRDRGGRGDQKGTQEVQGNLVGRLRDGERQETPRGKNEGYPVHLRRRQNHREAWGQERRGHVQGRSVQDAGANRRHHQGQDARRHLQVQGQGADHLRRRGGRAAGRVRVERRLEDATRRPQTGEGLSVIRRL